MDNTNSNDSNSIHSPDSSDMFNNKLCFVLITTREPNHSYIRKMPRYGALMRSLSLLSIIISMNNSKKKEKIKKILSTMRNRNDVYQHPTVVCSCFH